MLMTPVLRKIPQCVYVDADKAKGTNVLCEVHLTCWVLVTSHTMAHLTFNMTQWRIMMSFVWMKILSLSGGGGGG